MITLKSYLATVEIEKIKIFGKGYIVDCCVALFQKEQKDEAFRIYIATAAQFIAENTAHAVKGGKYMTMAYKDMFNKQDERSGDEIAEDVLKKSGLLGD